MSEEISLTRDGQLKMRVDNATSFPLDVELIPTPLLGGVIIKVSISRSTLMERIKGAFSILMN